MYPITLPTGSQAVIREMTGTEEEILTNQRLIRNGDGINQVLKNCLVSIGENEAPNMRDVLDLLAGDRLFLLLKLRQVSLGDTLDIESQCTNPTCRQKIAVEVDLNGVEHTTYSLEREFTTTLPRSQKSVTFTHLDGHKEKRLAALKEAGPTEAMLIRIKDIDGKPPSKKVMREMSLADRNALRKAMQEVDAGPDTRVELECDACGQHQITRIEAEPAFLFPGLHF